MMGERLIRTIGKVAYEVRLSFCSGDGWTATVMQGGKVIGSYTGSGKEYVLQCALALMQSYLPDGACCQGGVKPMVGTMGEVVVGGALQRAKGKLPRRPWQKVW